MIKNTSIALAALAVGLAGPVSAQTPPPNPIEALAQSLDIDAAALLDCVGAPDPGARADAPPPGDAMAMQPPPGDGAGPGAGPGGPQPFDPAALYACVQQQDPGITQDQLTAAMPQPPKH